MAKKCSKFEATARVDQIARMLVSAATTSQIVRYAAEHWGIGRRQCEIYLARAREQVCLDYSSERQLFLATRLGVLDQVSQRALKEGNLAAAVSAVRLQAELVKLVD